MSLNSMVGLLEELYSIKMLMAARILAAGQGGLRGRFTLKKLEIHLWSEKPVALQDVPVYLALCQSGLVRIDTEGSVNRMAREMLALGVSPSDMEELLGYCRDAASRIVQNDDGIWCVTNYGPNNDRTVTFEEFLKDSKRVA